MKAVRYSQLGGPEQVVTISDFGGAKEHGVRFSSGSDAGRAVHAIAEVGELVESGRFSLPVARTFPLAEVAEAHRVSEDGHVRGKLVLVHGPGLRVQTFSISGGASEPKFGEQLGGRKYLDATIASTC